MKVEQMILKHFFIYAIQLHLDYDCGSIMFLMCFMAFDCMGSLSLISHTQEEKNICVWWEPGWSSSHDLEWEMLM